MGDKTNINFLPVEMIEKILECPDLRIFDIINFSLSCSNFYEIIRSNNKIWRVKFKQRWPRIYSNDYYKTGKEVSWIDEARERSIIGRKTMNLVSGMSARHIMHDELSPEDFSSFDDLYTTCTHQLGLSFMIDELMQCINCENREASRTPELVGRNMDLTIKYYSRKALNHLRQKDLKRQWDIFKNKCLAEQLLESGAVIIAQWCQPTEDITDEMIGKKLDRIAENVLDAIRMEHGDEHPALNMYNEYKDIWRSENIIDNFYHPNVAWQVLLAVSRVLFIEMGFQGDSLAYYSPDNSYINKVLEVRRGIPITLAILFESVARRVGIKCEPVSFPGHFLLRWRESYGDDSQSKYHYIDVFNGGVLLGTEDCPRFNLANILSVSDFLQYGSATTLKVVERLASNLELAGRQRSMLTPHSTCLRSALELLNMINPCNIHAIEELAKYYMEYNMNVGSIMGNLNKITMTDLRQLGQATALLLSLQDYDFQYKLIPQNRELKVKKREGLLIEFAVGMVMRHRRFNYTCVIIGWDQQCCASEEWTIQMNVRSLKRKENQPFYNVLASDGSTRYAAEENLVTVPPGTWVTHGDVGRYFKQFHESHYEMNEETRLMYPDDTDYLLTRLSS